MSPYQTPHEVHHRTLIFHGVDIQLYSPDLQFLEICQLHLISTATEASRSYKKLNIYFNPEPFDDKLLSQLDHIGDNLYIGKKQLIWLNSFGYRLRMISPSANELNVYMFHNALTADSTNEDRFKNYIRSIRWGVVFPLFALLKSLGSVSILHASSIIHQNAAFSFYGLNRVGKSSLARFFNEQFSSPILSDNFMILDGDIVLKSPEPIRVPIGLTQDTSNVYATAYEKCFYPIEDSPGQYSCKLQKFFILANASSLSCSRLSHSAALDFVLRSQRMLSEFPENNFMSFFSAVFPEFDCESEYLTLPNDAQYYYLKLPHNLDLSIVTSFILNL